MFFNIPLIMVFVKGAAPGRPCRSCPDLNNSNPDLPQRRFFYLYQPYPKRNTMPEYSDCSVACQQQYQELEKELENLKQKCAFLQQVLDQVPANIYVSDLDQGVVWCNKTNEDTLGYTLAEIREMGGMEYLYRVVHPEDHVVPDSSITHYQEFDGAEYGGVFRARHRLFPEYKWFMGWAKAFRKDAAGKVKELVCVDVDLSPRMNTETQLVEALKANLQLKNKLLVKKLGKREMEVLTLIGKGHSSKSIADLLFLSLHTVNTHRRNIQHKLGTTRAAELVSLAHEAGLT
jgi:DNA-binding CsgD family transcriptional regulator/PAS domain-containing protein